MPPSLNSSYSRWPLTRRPIALLSALAAIFVLYVAQSQIIAPSPGRGTLSNLSALQFKSSCPSTPLKPNLILSAIDGEWMLERIFSFMGSLDTALGNEMLRAQREGKCLPAEVHVKIIAPLLFVHSLPDGFKTLLRRYTNLEIVGALPDKDVSIVLNRFAGWSSVVEDVQHSYDKILAADLDIVFQRNPFNMPMDLDVELLIFAEWRGFKIGQCGIHVSWFDGCAHTSVGAFIPPADSESYATLDRICAGSTYGTARAMAVYLGLMASELAYSRYECNDQALHIHLYYSNKLQDALTANSAGRVRLVPNEEALLGTVGTTPFVRYNEWGEMLNDFGEVQVAVHQYKQHHKLFQMVERKYAWQAELSKSFPPQPVLIKDVTFRPEDPTSKESRYTLSNLDDQTCADEHALCSCRWDNCQFGY